MIGEDKHTTAAWIVGALVLFTANAAYLADAIGKVLFSIAIAVGLLGPSLYLDLRRKK